jgi:pimeloyl-ACP methyl ester carboxylesterase
MDIPRFVSAGGVKTRYFVAGSGDPLVLIHGSAFGEADSSADEWDPVFDRFSQVYRSYAYDKIGQGFTDNPIDDAGYVIGTTVDHAAHFIEALGLGPAHVIGHSRGAYTACRLALEAPHLVHTLVLVDSSTLMSHDSGFYETLDEQVSTIDDVRERYRFMIRAHSWSAEHITNDWLDRILEIHALAKTRAAATIMGAGPLPGSGGSYPSGPGRGQAFLQDLYRRQQETHAWIRDGRLQVPTLVVWGFNDPSAPLEPVGLDAMRLILPHAPRARMDVINRAGHYCFREQPEAFCAAVLSFLS